MNLVRREGFVTALREGILWYSTTQQEHGPEAAEALAQRFADAVDHTKKGSVLDIVYSPPRFLRRYKRWYKITARAHRQTFGDPPHRYRRLRPQARSKSQLH